MLTTNRRLHFGNGLFWVSVTMDGKIRCLATFPTDFLALCRHLFFTLAADVEPPNIYRDI